MGAHVKQGLEHLAQFVLNFPGAGEPLKAVAQGRDLIRTVLSRKCVETRVLLE